MTMTNNVWDDFLEEDANAAPAIGDNALKSVSSLANRLVALEEDIEYQEQKLAALKRDHRQLATKDLPDAMIEVGMSEFKMVDGRKISVDDFVEAHISKENEPAAFAYLRDNGHESIIKTSVTADFGKGQDDRVDAFRQKALEVASKVTTKEGVHAATLKKWVREGLESGLQIPEETFGVYRGRVAKVKK